jgi:hypothetical protein
VIDQEIPADADEPRLKVRSPVERVQGPEDLQKDVLREIFGFVVPAHELVREVEDLAPVETNDLGPGRLIATEAPVDELIESRG